MILSLTEGPIVVLYAHADGHLSASCYFLEACAINIEFKTLSNQKQF